VALSPSPCRSRTEEIIRLRRDISVLVLSVIELAEGQENQKTRKTTSHGRHSAKALTTTVGSATRTSWCVTTSLLCLLPRIPICWAASLKELLRMKPVANLDGCAP